MRQRLKILGYLLGAIFFIWSAYQLLHIYAQDAGTLRMMKNKQEQMSKEKSLDASWIATNRSCDASMSTQKLNEASLKHSVKLVRVEPQAKKLCDGYMLADEKSVLECYPLRMVWLSDFSDGVAFIKEYQASCMFLFEHIKMNIVDYPQAQWEISGWTVQKGTL